VSNIAKAQSKLVAAQNCHPGAVQTLIAEALDALDEFSRSPMTQQPQAEVITEALIDAYLEDYEMRSETEDGQDACYTPSEGEKFLIKDAIMGLLAEVPLKQPQAEAVAWRARDANDRWMYGDLPAPDLPAGEAELLALAAPQQAEAVPQLHVVGPRPVEWKIKSIKWPDGFWSTPPSITSNNELELILLAQKVGGQIEYEGPING